MFLLILKIDLYSQLIANAGDDKEICQGTTVQLGGAPVAQGGSGDYSFSWIPTDDLDDPTDSIPLTNTIISRIYTLVVTDNIYGDTDTSSITITVNQLPIVDAGPNQVICESEISFGIVGSVSGITTTGVWSTSGSGTITPSNTSLNINYTPSSEDKLNGSVEFVLTSTNNGICPAQSDSVLITFSRMPLVDAGNDRSICSNNSTINLNGSVSGGTTSGIWSSNGSGTFLPNDSTLNASYLPSVQDIINESIYLTLTSTNNNNCQSQSDLLLVNFYNAPIVNAGEDQALCITGNIMSVSLIGSITGTSGTGVWSTTGDGTFPAGNDDLFTSYNLGDNDKISDSITIILTSTKNGECLPVSDSLNLRIYPKIYANAGYDTIICNINNSIELNGSVTGATTSGTWITRGKGTFIPTPNLPITSYLPDISDTINTGFYLVLTSTQNQGCPSSSDSLLITIEKNPVVKAGSDTSVNTRSVPLHGIVNNSNSIKWITNGSGSFYPSDTLADTRYIFSTNEIITGNEVVLVINSVNKYCPIVSDSILVFNFSNKMPNVFTPDDDGYNDLFMKNEELEVYNRWGQLLYKGKDGWDGKYKNEKVSPGTYFYIVTYRNEQNKTSTIRGTVTIITK